VTIRDIHIRDGIHLENVTYIEHGDLKGYVNAMLVDRRTDAKFKNFGYETLFRVHDPINGPDMTLVSVDYGWKLEDDSIITDAEKAITEEMMNVLN
jgi:hypothetical protein